MANSLWENIAGAISVTTEKVRRASVGFALSMRKSTEDATDMTQRQLMGKVIWTLKKGGIPTAKYAKTGRWTECVDTGFSASQAYDNPGIDISFHSPHSVYPEMRERSKHREAELRKKAAEVLQDAGYDVTLCTNGHGLVSFRVHEKIKDEEETKDNG